MAKKRNLEALARRMVGDGKKPNRFFLSVSSDYSYIEGAEVNYIGDLIKGWQEKYSKGEVFGMYKTIEEAMQAASEFEIGLGWAEKFIVNRITIEDRLNGQVYEKELILDISDGSTFTSEDDDTHLLQVKKAR